MKKIDKYILIYPESHKHLGLFKDLENQSDVELYVATRKKPKNLFTKCADKIHNSGFISKYVKLPFKNIWYTKPKLNIDKNKQYSIIIIDAAMKMYSTNQLNKLFSLKNVNGTLVLLNSMNAESAAIFDIKSRMLKINWKNIYTFDPKDAEKYNFKYLGCCYYSKKSYEEIMSSDLECEKSSDAYFVGSLKGNRKQLILDVFEKCIKNKLYADFQIMLSGAARIQDKPYEDTINYFTGGWLPYEHILKKTLNTNVIIEVLQQGQNGPSLRYYEAVCYNKKLLTNNPEIVNLPFYDERYMKFFSTAEDIDTDWIYKKENIEYNYQNEFSPINMLNILE